MRFIAHLSDLHFGAIADHAVHALLDDLNALRPNLAVISGDVTQRARSAQFMASRAFLDALPCPWLSVPGNHDIPLFNLYRRWLKPRSQYRRHLHADGVSPDAFPRMSDGEIAVAGLDTTKPFGWVEGRLSRSQIERIGQWFERQGPDTVRILFSHHDIEPLLRRNTPKSRRLCKLVEDARLDLLLSGHLHTPKLSETESPPCSTVSYADRRPVALRAGTATSSRLRNTPNTFNMIRIDPGAIHVSVRTLQDAGFTESAAAGYERREGRWRLLEQ